MAPQIIELQSLAGNAAVTRMLRSFGTVGIARAVDTNAPEAPSAALDDPSFNADSIAHDLLRAINQNEHTFVVGAGGVEDPTKERRNVDFPKVVAVLEDKTPSQIAEIERRYRDFEKRNLTFDLFEGGESNLQSSLTQDQRARIAVLLKGTRGETISTQVLADLKKYPPDIAAQIGAALVAKSNAAAALQQFEADSIEVHELLCDTLDEPHLERLMALYRRDVKEVTAMDAFFAQRFGAHTFDVLLLMGLGNLQRLRLLALRRGDRAQADAYAIEDKRRSIAAINKDEQGDAALDSTSVGSMIREQREKKKAALSGDIEGILDNNRREALSDPANMGMSSGQAVANRLNKILGQRVGEAGATLGSDLTGTLGREHANIISAASDLWNTSGSASLIESAAAELVAMEKDHTTSAVKIIQTLRSFRTLATHDLHAHVLDPSVRPAEKQAIGADIDSAITGLAQEYIQEYRAAYERRRGEGRSYDAIVKSADTADETLLGDLAIGGGHTSDLGELQHAMDKKDIDKVKQILRNQPGQQAIKELVAAYNRLGDGRDLRKELFGTLQGQQASPEMAESDDTIWLVKGLAKGRDAAQIEEQLEKPSTEEPTGKAAAGPEHTPSMLGQAEVNWLAKGGAREFEVTMGNRGWTGKLRETGSDPETEHLLKSSNAQLAQLAQQYAAAQTPALRQHLLLQIRKTRAALTGDADAYEKDNERVLGEIRSALSFAVSIALAIAIPGAGAGLVAFIETTAINVAANVAANMVIKGGDYGWDDLKGDVLGGVLGAAGGKFGEELLGRVAVKITSATGKAAAGVGEKVGIQTALAREVSTVATSGERVAIGAEEFEAREAGHEAATAHTEQGGAAAATNGAERGLLETGSREVGAFFGGIYGGKLPTGDFGLSVEEVLKALAATAAGKTAHRQKAGGASTEERSTNKSGASDETPQQETEPHETEPREPAERESEPTLGAIGHEAPPAHADGLGPRSPADMLADNGLPADGARGFQEFADQHNLIIKVRPTNTASLPVLAEGGLPKAEIVKAKTLNRTDMLIGGPAGHEGKVGFFEPTMPRQEILDVLSPEARTQVTERYNQRLEEFRHYSQEYAQLAAEGLVRIDNGVLQIADPTQAATPDAPRGPFKDVGGDHDVYDIRHADDGSPLTDAERALATAMLRSMNINVEHGFHMAWEMDSPATYSAEADAKIREQHTQREPLVAFVPKSTPREVYADTEVRGPERTVGPQDRHRPLKGATAVEPTDIPPHGAPGSGGPGEVHAPDETDFSSVGSPEKEPRNQAQEQHGQTEAPVPREARPVDPTGSPERTLVRDVLPELNESKALVDRLTYAVIHEGLVRVEQVEDLPHLSGAELMARKVDPRTHAIVVHPRLGELTIQLDAVGYEVGRGEVLVSHRMTPEQVKQTLRHEVNHVLRPPVEKAGSLQHYQDEFDAAWMDGSFNEYPRNKRAIEIRKHILESYEELGNAYAADEDFQKEVKNYRRPKGNTLNSVVWSNVQVELTSTEPGREMRALEDIRHASPEERRALKESPDFEELLKQHLSGVFLNNARKLLSES